VISCSCYLRKGIVYLPTYALAEAGFYTMIDPAAAVPVSDTEALKRALIETFARGNPTVRRRRGTIVPNRRS
jgi:hypothetical protein